MNKVKAVFIHKFEKEVTYA